MGSHSPPPLPAPSVARVSTTLWHCPRLAGHHCPGFGSQAAVCGPVQPVHLLFPSQWLYVLKPRGSTFFLSWEGREPLGCYQGPALLWNLMLSALKIGLKLPWQGLSLSAITHPYHRFWSVLCSLCLPNYISVQILLAVHFVLKKDSWVSQMGAQTSAISSHLLCHHLPWFFCSHHLSEF